MTTEALARWVASHGFTTVLDRTRGCVHVVIPTTRNAVPSYPIVETVHNMAEARKALGC